MNLIEDYLWINISQNELLNFIYTNCIGYFILTASYTFCYETIRCKMANLFIIAMLR